MSDQTLLLVDDDDSNRFTLGALLEDAGYTVVEANCAAAARAKLSSAAFRAAIFDLNLGDGLGTELVAPFKQAHPTAKVLLLTGEVGASGASVDGVLAKGDSPDETIARIGKLLGGVSA